MNAARFLKLIEAVENAPDEQFDMSNWKNVNCETGACACGWYALSRPNAFRWEPEIGWTEIGSPTDYACPSYRGWAEHFGIETYQAAFLFAPESYRGGDDRPTVLARLKSFYESHKSKEPLPA